MTKVEALKLLRAGTAGIYEFNSRFHSGEDVPNLPDADLEGMNLDMVCLGATISRRGGLRFQKLERANLRGVSLRGASLRGVDLNDADLSGADLTGAVLGEFGLGAMQVRTWLQGADLSNATFGFTTITCDLNGVRGLASIKHVGPSYLAVDAILNTDDDIPESFLRGCGLREEDIAHFRTRLNSPIRFYSVFISYSAQDEEFATRLHDDFKAVGIRCWKWDCDARTGRSIWEEIDQAIRIHDKLVLIASEASLKSPAVNREIERALQQEDARMKRRLGGEDNVVADVLFPVRVDDYLFTAWEHERKADVVRKVVADARGWNSDATVYPRVRDRLICDLKAST